MILATCPNCFFDHGDGLFHVVMEPLTTWQEGGYHLQLRVVIGGATLFKLFTVEVIP